MRAARSAGNPYQIVIVDAAVAGTEGVAHDVASDDAGGIIAAAHSKDTRYYSPFPVDPATVVSMISTSIRANAKTILTQGRRRGITPHAAARQVAQDRVREAMSRRGRVPV